MLKVTINIENQQLQFEAKTFMLEGNRLTIELPDARVELKHEPVFYPVPNAGCTNEMTASTAIKVCPICHQEYKPSNNAQVICQACKKIALESGKNIYKGPQRRYPDDHGKKDKKDYYGPSGNKKRSHTTKNRTGVLKGTPAATGIKKCVVCGCDYKPKGNAQRKCDTCKNGLTQKHTPEPTSATLPVTVKDVQTKPESQKIVIPKEILDPMGLKGDKPRFVQNGE